MLLTITTTHQPSTDVEHLLRKPPGKTHVFERSFGRANVFYPEATEKACTAALLLEVGPLGLVLNRRGPAGEGRSPEHNVNDRPYVASSFLSVALGDVFSSAMAGTPKDRAELVDAAILIKTIIYRTVPRRRKFAETRYSRLLSRPFDIYSGIITNFRRTR